MELAETASVADSSCRALLEREQEQIVPQRSPRTGDPPLDGPGAPFFGPSLLFPQGDGEEPSSTSADDAYASDLNLDQVIASVAADLEEHDLVTAVLSRPRRDPATIRFRQEVFEDLEDASLRRNIEAATERLQKVRSQLAQLPNMRSTPQRHGWFLDAVANYCEACERLRAALHAGHVASRGLLAFRDIFDDYCSSPSFRTLTAETAERKQALGQIRYTVRIRGGRVDVSRYEGELDYSAEVLKTFERFAQGAAKDYRVRYRTWPGMDHVGEQILDLVTRLFSEEFTALGEHCRRHHGFFDPGVRRFEREVQFYLAYLRYTGPLREAGLPLCSPQVGTSKEVFATDTFDLALAHKLVGEGRRVVGNDFALSGPERILVVSGPNQGGKSTFARTFGQLHHLASVGCPVPGSAARLFLFDRLFTHFEREEDLAAMSGKLQDDLARIRHVLLEATSDSIVILNEIFSSTTLHDARLLGAKVLTKMVQLDLLAVYVTFVDELASLAPSVVSMVSTVVPDDPAQRTFKVVRGQADGLAYALAIAERYGLTYQRLRERIRR